jgi:hypothetical protein
MDQFVQYLPYDALGKRTLRLEQDKLVLTYKNLTRNYTDEFPFEKINPVFKYVKRGESEWDGVLLGLVVSAIALVLFTKMLHSLIVRTVFLSIQVCMLFAAVYLLAIKFIKRDYCYILDDSGDVIVALKVTPHAKAFIAKLSEKMKNSGQIKA